MARLPKDQRPTKTPRKSASRRGDTDIEVPTKIKVETELDGDVAFALGRDENGVHILRRRSAAAPVEAGILIPLQEGKSIVGEVVSLRPRPEAPFLFDVKAEFNASEPDRTNGDGPAQVANDAYRKGWDAVWGTSRRRDRSVN